MQRSPQNHARKRRPASRRLRALLLLVSSLLILGAWPMCAQAAVSDPPFPRLAAWWPGSAPAADIAKRDYVMLGEDDPAHPTQDRSAILAQNPNMMFMAEGSARELYYRVGGGDPAFEAQRLGAVPRSWVLLQVGSTLSQAVTSLSSTALKVSVVNSALFRVGDLLLVDKEYMHVTGVSSGTPGSLTVRRAMAGSAASTHSTGAKVNAAVSSWPGSVTLNMTNDCPDGVATGDFASPAPEKANAWMARRNVGCYRSRAYDGIMVDVANEFLYYSFKAADGNGGPIRSIGTVANPNIPVPDYDAFDLTWQAGIRQMFKYMRAAEPAAVIIANGSASNDLVTAGVYEDVPRTTQSIEYWNKYFFGTRPWINANSIQYKDWNNTPNFTTIVTYTSPTDYHGLRFGLCTCLMGDGYFVHRGGTAASPANNVLYWFDEFDGGGIGKGYLGHPTGSAYQTGSAWRREYSGGVVLVNPCSSSVTVSLGGVFRKIKGTQAPTVNNGYVVNAVTIPARDGIILLRAAPGTPLTSTLTCKPSTSVVYYGHSVTLSGRLTPALTGLQVGIYYRKPRSTTWVRLTTVSTNSTGCWVRRQSLKIRGTWYFRASFAGTASQTRACSPYYKVQVR